MSKECRAVEDQDEVDNLAAEASEVADHHKLVGVLDWLAQSLMTTTKFSELTALATLDVPRRNVSKYEVWNTVPEESTAVLKISKIFSRNVYDTVLAAITSSIRSAVLIRYRLVTAWRTHSIIQTRSEKSTIFRVWSKVPEGSTLMSWDG